MPYSERHRQQKAKNYTVMAILLAIVVVLFVVSVLKISGSL